MTTIKSSYTFAGITHPPNNAGQHVLLPTAGAGANTGVVAQTVPNEDASTAPAPVLNPRAMNNAIPSSTPVPVFHFSKFGIGRYL